MEEEKNLGFEKTVNLFGRETSLAELNVWARLAMLVVCIGTLTVNIIELRRNR